MVLQDHQDHSQPTSHWSNKHIFSKKLNLLLLICVFSLGISLVSSDAFKKWRIHRKNSTTDANNCVKSAFNQKSDLRTRMVNQKSDLRTRMVKLRNHKNLDISKFFHQFFPIFFPPFYYQYHLSANFSLCRW